MTVEIRIESEEKLHIPYRRIIEDVVSASLAYEKCPYDGEISVTLTDGPGIRKLNKKFRKTDRETDVLSFPMTEFHKPADFRRTIIRDALNPVTGELLLGDIVINVSRVRSQAEEYGHTQKRELAFLTVHSMLHLMGYDHMQEKERILMEEHQRMILNSRGYTRGE
jgi:probable rRNA maturation factor